MAGRQLPGLGLKGDWALGEDNWKDENDLNLLTLSVLTQGRVLALQPLETDPPTQGDIVILDDTHATHANAIAVYDEGAWLYIPAVEGMMMWNLDDSIRYEFKAGAWAELSAGFDDAPADGKTYGRKDEAWAEIVAGDTGNPGGPEELLANVKLTAEGTFPVIDTTGFRSVRIVFNLKKGGANGDITAATFRFNGAATGYYQKNMYAAGGGSGIESDGHALNAAQGAFALISTRSPNAKLSAGGEVIITGLDNTSLNKNWSARNAAYRELDGSVFNYTVQGFWDNIAAVNSIQIMETFAVDSSIQVFGVRAGIAPNPTHAPGGPNTLELTPLPAFQNGWVEYGGAYSPMKIVKTGRVVTITGLVKSGTTPTLMTLPLGWRPENSIQSYTTAGGGTAYIEVTAAGIVTLNYTSGPGVAVGTVINMSFMVPEIDAYNGGESGLIQSVILAANTGLVTFDNIPQRYRELYLTMLVGGTSQNALVNMTFNNDNGANYARWRSNKLGIATADPTNFIEVGQIDLTLPNPYTLSIPGYRSATLKKGVHGGGMQYNAGNYANEATGGWWKAAAAAINRIDLAASAGQFLAGSEFHLYGR